MAGYAVPSLSDLINCMPTIEAQVTLVVLQAVFWCVTIPRIGKACRGYIEKQTWGKQWLKLNRDTMKKALMVEFKDEETAWDVCCEINGILLQHGVGGLLAGMAVYAPISTEAARILAGHGALCEVGWELQDVFVRAYQIIFGGETGKAKNPLPLCIFMGIHHTMGLGIAVPLNMSRFATESAFHEMVFLLQFAAFVAMFAQQYGYTLDVHTASGLKKMKVTITFVFLGITWSRGLRFVMLGWQLFWLFWSSGAMTFVYGGLTVLLMMSMINTIFLTDAFAKFVKFMKMSAVTEDDDEDAFMEREDTMTDLFGSMNAIRVTKAHTRWTKVKSAVKMMGVMKRVDGSGKQQKPKKNKDE